MEGGIAFEKANEIASDDEVWRLFWEPPNDRDIYMIIRRTTSVGLLFIDEFVAIGIEALIQHLTAICADPFNQRGLDHNADNPLTIISLSAMRGSVERILQSPSEEED
jgi:hypothetical protein